MSSERSAGEGAAELLGESLHAMGDSVILLDSKGRVAFINRAGGTWLGGYDSIWAHPETEKAPACKDAYEAAMRTANPTDVELRTSDDLIEWRFFPHEGGCTIVRRDLSGRLATQKQLEHQLAMAREIVDKIGTDNSDLIVLSERDTLTGLNNRGRYDEFVESSFYLARSRHQPWALVVFDIDHFKRFNDEFGHQVGDEALKAVAEVVKAHAKPGEFIARYGGEEFAIVSSGIKGREAVARADRLRQAIGTIKTLPSAISASFGVAIRAHSDTCPTDVFERADQALYQAKKLGRNRVHVANVSGMVDDLPLAS